MIALAPYTPGMEDFSDQITEAISMDIDPNSVFKLPEGCSFIAPSEDGPGQLLLVLSKHEANTARTAFDPPFWEANGDISTFPFLLHFTLPGTILWFRICH